MPLFTYRCTGCNITTEKFLHSIANEEEIVCKECGSKCEKLFAPCKSRTILDAADTLSQQIAPDAKNMVNKLRSGSDKDFFDVYGDN